MSDALDQFVAKYDGRRTPNNHGSFVGECVSLAARYAQEVQGVPDADAVLYCSNTGGARDLYEQFDGQLPAYYERIPATQPRQRGDLVIWGDNLGHYGDVAVALDSGSTIFGQLGTPVFIPANIRNEKRQPLGYLRRKGSEEVSKVDLNLAREQADAQWGWGERTPERDAILNRDIVGRETNEAIDFMYNHEWGGIWRNYRNQLQSFWNDFHEKIAKGELDITDSSVQAALAKIQEAAALLGKVK